jgi:hypothetical protein
MSLAELWCAVAWFALFVLALRTMVRAFPRHSPAAIAMGSACLFLAASLPVAALLPVSANYWRSLAVFGFLTVCCLMVFGAAYKSISLRVLLELSRAPSRRVETRQLLQRYIEGESFEARIGAMTGQGLADKVGEGIGLSRTGRRLAVATDRIQRLYRIEESG